MGRIRTIKPEFFRSRSLAKVTLPARLTFQGLWCEADDHGRGIADPRILKGVLWALDDDMTADDVLDHLDQLERTGHIRRYEVDGDAFYEVVAWEKHQAAAYRRGVAVHPEPPPPEPEQPPHDEECKNVQAARPVVLEGNWEGNEDWNEEAPHDAAQPLVARISEPRHFVEHVEPSGPVAVRTETTTVLDIAAARAGDRPLLASQRRDLRPAIEEALRAGYRSDELADAIASSPVRTPRGVMAELGKRKQPTSQQRRQSVGDAGLTAANEWLQTVEGA